MNWVQLLLELGVPIRSHLRSPLEYLPCSSRWGDGGETGGRFDERYCGDLLSSWRRVVVEREERKERVSVVPFMYLVKYSFSMKRFVFKNIFQYLFKGNVATI